MRGEARTGCEPGTSVETRPIGPSMMDDQSLDREREEETDAYKKRVKRLESKQILKIGDVEFYSPNTEMDVIAIANGIQALVPDILPFVVRDYDSHFGFDGLATRNKSLKPTEAAHLFVEFKYELKGEFNHTFEKLEAIVC